MLNIDKYISHLPLDIKKRNQKFINIRCPICGDSSSNRFKARGFILLNKDEPYYNCFNECGNISFYNFLDFFDSQLAKEYYKDTRLRRQQLKGNNSKEIKKLFDTEIDMEKILEDEIYNPLELDYKIYNRAYYKKTVNDVQVEYDYELKELPEEAIRYLEEERGFTKDDYKDYKFVEETNDITIPYFLDKSKNIIYGMQMRNLYEKVFHNNFFNNSFKISNLENIIHLPKGSVIYVFEGEFDRKSTNLENSIAVLGSKLSIEAFNMLKGFKFVFCGDADKEGIKKSFYYAKQGWDILVHDLLFLEMKDFNKALEQGFTKEQITNYILENVKGPTRALIELRKFPL